MKNILAILFLASFLGYSQDSLKTIISPNIPKLEPIPMLTLKEFTLESDRISFSEMEEGRSVVVLSKEKIKNTPAISINELLVQVAGVDIRQRGSNGVQADVGIRGSTFDQVLILLNGIRMSDPQTGHHSLNIPVDVASIERIEIVKGAGARVYGQNALSGVINIITKVPNESFLSEKVVAGDFNLYDITVSGGIKGEKANHLISLNRNASDGYKYNTDYEITNAFYSSKLSFNKKKEKRQFLTFMSGFTEKKFGANGFYSSPSAIDQYEETQTSVVSIKYENKLSKKISVNTTTYWRRNQDKYLFLRQNPSFFRNMHINNTLGVNLNMVYTNKLGETALGIDVSKVWIQSNNLGKRQREVQTAFLEHKFSLLENRLFITPGIQASYFSDFDGVFLPGIDASYRINKKITAFANAGYTYRVPTYTDLFYQGRTNIGNENLNPEIALSYEGGMRARLGFFKFQASYFVREGKNIIDWTRPDEASPWQPNNLVQLTTQGIDADATWQPLTNKYIQSIGIGYTYLDQETEVEDGLLSKYALENLNHQVTAFLAVNYHKNITHSLNYRYTDRVNLDDYSVLDTKLAFDNGKILVYGEISNLLNQEYRETNLVVMPGRWFRIGVGCTLNKLK
jgi:vitamin B12 transporter